jgi:hypothetical protein
MKAEDSHDHPPLPTSTATSPTFHLHQINSHLPRQPDQPIIPCLGHDKHALYITLHLRPPQLLRHLPDARGGLCELSSERSAILRIVQV